MRSLKNDEGGRVSSACGPYSNYRASNLSQQVRDAVSLHQKMKLKLKLQRLRDRNSRVDKHVYHRTCG